MRRGANVALLVFFLALSTFVILAELAHWLPAPTGRQVLLPNALWRKAVQDVLLRGESSEVPGERVRVKYVVFDRGLANTLVFLWTISMSAVFLGSAPEGSPACGYRIQPAEN